MDEPPFQLRPILTLCCVVGSLLCLSSRAHAHIEAAEIAADVTWNRTKAVVTVRTAVRELINAEQPPDAVVMPDFNQDPQVVTKRHIDDVLKGFHIRYDGKELTAHMLKTDVQSLVIGVSEEDIIPRICSVFYMEFDGGENPAGPGRIDMSMNMFQLPPDAGYQPTVLCLVTHSQVGVEKSRMAVIGQDDSLTVQPKWSDQPATAPTDAAPPRALITPAAAPAPPIAAPANHSRGPLIVLALGGVVGIALLIVLARKRV